jgi:hypothetical protein
MLADSAILAMITKVAAQLDETAPTSIQYVRGSRGYLNRGASGAEIGGTRANRPAVLVQAVGEFTRMRPGIVPKGVSPLKTYTVLTLIIDDKTGQATDRGFGFKRVDLAALGGVVDLTPENVLPESAIVDTTMRVAAQFNDPTPASIEYAYGTRNELNSAASGATFDGDIGEASSVLVQATGNFRWFHSAPTNRHHISTGSAFTIVIDQQTGNVTDRGVTEQPVDLSPLGPVFHPTLPKG